MSDIRLDRYNNNQWQRGAPRYVEVLWKLISFFMFRGAIPGSYHRRVLLRLFGAKVGRGVVLKPGVRIKFPWRISIGDHTWIGEDAWIDNLANVTIGSNVCVSQGAYLCTGSHDWSSEAFDLIVKPIIVEDGAWISAKSIVGPGVTIGRGTVLALGAVATRTLEPGWICIGNPAKQMKRRSIEGKQARK